MEIVMKMIMTSRDFNSTQEYFNYLIQDEFVKQNFNDFLVELNEDSEYVITAQDVIDDSELFHQWLELV
jgi:hypothetical protein